MGVPKFYRWISERYPCLSERVKEYQVPDFDNLYLDMNGIIHNCSHPNDEDPHFRISEEQIFKDIFHYIEVLFRIIQPKKTFFMAVDGVAPRAKMNQQRGRRFRSAKDAQNKIEAAKRKGEVLPSEDRFDSNCITPGTKFMTRLQEQLEYFIKYKVTTDSMWQGKKVLLSGHQTPGEGEHKIMEFIRHERSKPDYDVNTRHCMYGLDADLLVLALCSHEPHFSLLREEVQFTKSKSSKAIARAEETVFHLLHISILREYIGLEFQSLKEPLGERYNIESIIDDWVLMGFLVGNDFVPHLPNFHISGNALSFLYNCYIEVMPTLDGYLNQDGIINCERFQKYIDRVCEFDVEKYRLDADSHKWLASKKLGTQVVSFNKETRENNNNAAAGNVETNLKIIKELAVKQGILPSCENDTDAEEDDEEDLFRQQKRFYYAEKFELDPTREQIGAIAHEYVLALQWICHYYYNGVQSWGWFYPYHYSPYVSDLKNMASMRLKYKLGRPFTPFQQLLAVLPAASRSCIPEQLWPLMEESNSPISDFYPENFNTDLNGKQQEWEAVVLIPFIDETRLLEAMAPHVEAMSAEDKQRNKHVKCKCFTHDPHNPYFVKTTLPTHSTDIHNCTARLEEIATESWVKRNYNDYVKGLLPQCDLSVYFQGFPTLYHMQHTAKLSKEGVRVFQAASRGENMIIKINPASVEAASPDSEPMQWFSSENQSITDQQLKLLGETVFVNWPHMEEARVVGISDGKVKYTYKEDPRHNGQNNNEGGLQQQRSESVVGRVDRRNMSAKDQSVFNTSVFDIHRRCMSRRGVDVGETKILVYAQLLLGRKYVCEGETGKLMLEKQWSTIVQPYALQTIIYNIKTMTSDYVKNKSLGDLFPVNSDVFNLGETHYGCSAKVVSTEEGEVCVRVNVPREPDLSVIMHRKGRNPNYLTREKAANQLKIDKYLLTRLTGSLYICYPHTQKWNLGLNIRFKAEKCGVAGYTLYCHDNRWLFSKQLLPIIADYLTRYPQVVKYLQENLSGQDERLDAEEMFEGEDVTEKLREISKYLKSLPCHGCSKVHESSNILETNDIGTLAQIVDDHHKKSASECEEWVTKVKPHLLYRPLTHQGTMVPDKKAKHQVLDRVVNVREGYTVPVNWRGTVIGRHIKGNAENQIMLDVLFDKEFMGGLTLGGRCPDRRGYMLPVCAVINLSYGERHQKSSALNRSSPSHQQYSTGATSSFTSGNRNQQSSKNSFRSKKILQKSDSPGMSLEARHFDTKEKDECLGDIEASEDKSAALTPSSGRPLSLSTRKVRIKKQRGLRQPQQQDCNDGAVLWPSQGYVAQQPPPFPYYSSEACWPRQYSSQACCTYRDEDLAFDVPWATSNNCYCTYNTREWTSQSQDSCNNEESADKLREEILLEEAKANAVAATTGGGNGEDNNKPPPTSTPSTDAAAIQNGETVATATTTAAAEEKTPSAKSTTTTTAHHRNNNEVTSPVAETYSFAQFFPESMTKKFSTQLKELCSSMRIDEPVYTYQEHNDSGTNHVVASVEVKGAVSGGGGEKLHVKSGKHASRQRAVEDAACKALPLVRQQGVKTVTNNVQQPQQHFYPHHPPLSTYGPVVSPHHASGMAQQQPPPPHHHHHPQATFQPAPIPQQMQATVPPPTLPPHNAAVPIMSPHMYYPPTAAQFFPMPMHPHAMAAVPPPPPPPQASQQQQPQHRPPPISPYYDASRFPYSPYYVDPKTLSYGYPQPPLVIINNPSMMRYPPPAPYQQQQQQPQQQNKYVLSDQPVLPSQQ